MPGHKKLLCTINMTAVVKIQSTKIAGDNQSCTSAVTVTVMEFHYSQNKVSGRLMGKHSHLN